MITAIVLIQTERARTQSVAEALLEIKHVAEVYSVAGDFDLVAIVRVRQYDEMAEVVPRRIAAIQGIARTQTLMAFQYFSRHDLERMWGIGLEEGLGIGERGPGGAEH
jgi:DNA-binding Lrp family transcriptional regulator